MIELSDDLLAQWHPTLNIPLTIDTLTSVSKKVWWLGGCGHSWQATVFDRKRGYGCSYCAGKKILIGFNDLASQNPILAKEWHATKNSPLSPEEVSHRSSKKLWWECSEGHEWEAKIIHRANGSGCPVCRGRKTLSGFNDLATTNPDIATLWHPTKNAGLTPSDVTAGSAKKVWWICAMSHETSTIVTDKVSKKINCYYCSGMKTLKGFNDLQSQRPDLVKEWDFDANGDIRLNEINMGSQSKFWWKCQHGHKWLASVSARAMGQGCPVCCGNKVVVGFNDFASKSPELAKEWHPTKNGDKKPTDFTFSSGVKVWWLGKCGHEWQATIANRNIGTGCSVCAGKIVVIGFNDLAFKFPTIAAEWHPNKNGSLQPNMVTGSSSKKFWWQCDKGHDWAAAIAARTIRGSGCPECWVKTYISKPEEEIKDFLTTLGLNVIQSDRKVLRGKEIDLYIEDKKFGIEFNGLFWHNDNHKRDNHHYDKWVASQKAGITLIQVWEDDWRDRKHVILRALAHKLGVSDKMSQYYPELAEHTAKIGARKTWVSVLTTKIAREFLDRNHIQGFASGSYYLGLTDNEDVLRAVMVLKKESNNRLNIIRYATFGSIQGGFTKLLKYAANSYSPASFITFADHCISDGALYERHGFVVDKMIPPDYMYIVQNTRKHKFGYRLAKFRGSPVLKYEEGLTERELAKLNKIPRIWDAGKTRYVLNVKAV